MKSLQVAVAATNAVAAVTNTEAVKVGKAVKVVKVERPVQVADALHHHVLTDVFKIVVKKPQSSKFLQMKGLRLYLGPFLI